MNFSQPKLGFKTCFLIILLYYFREIGFTHVSYAATGFSCDNDEVTSYILYFFELGKNTKNLLLESSFSYFLTL